ncbi:acidic mammalian chitinase-like isoform X2 [Belonocnema kinseyi]|uniref:acidic mammalian chitinase-like isoform X2 n=1 Tax=Belonocnema kinseyi TaxID=2817044 RepID=UPI00143D640A|nr:acidic mammalian chitinase-like isoform X2 [Belonocnema kinseyi]
MHTLILCLGICSAFALGLKLPNPDEKSEKIVGCYTTGGDLAELDLLCTHMFYSYVGIDKDASIQIIDPYEDIEGQGYIEFNDLRKKNPKLKTLISIRNNDNHLLPNITNIDSPYRVVTDPALQEKLVNNIVNFVKKYGFSGIDLDLTDTSEFGGHPSDKGNLVSSLKALREKFDKEGLILSVLVDPNEETAKRFYDIKGISKYVNFINLRTFDFHGISDAEKKVGHTSPMYSSSKENAEDRKKNIDYVVKYWISQSAPPNKLILGTASYGTSYTLANSKQIGRGALFSDNGSISMMKNSKYRTSTMRIKLLPMRVLNPLKRRLYMLRK